MKKLFVTFFYLLDGEVIVIRGNRDVSTVNNLESGEERVHFKRYVVTSIQGQATRARANTSRSETSTWAVRCASVLGTKSSVEAFR